MLLNSISNLEGVPGNPKDWIGLYYSSASDRDYLSWKYLDGKTSGTITFSAPKEEGEYNLRIFENDGMTSLGKSTNFLVKKSIDQTKLQLEKDNFFPGEEMKLLFLLLLNLNPALDWDHPLRYSTR